VIVSEVLVNVIEVLLVIVIVSKVLVNVIRVLLVIVIRLLLECY
jgi:hypothetical protein